MVELLDVEVTRVALVVVAQAIPKDQLEANTEVSRRFLKPEICDAAARGEVTELSARVNRPTKWQLRGAPVGVNRIETLQAREQGGAFVVTWQFDLSTSPLHQGVFEPDQIKDFFEKAAVCVTEELGDLSK
ncbi:MAG: hypothetical protein JKY37_00640 [Nannocystaceae bacterium]|nr:hypothetical protein [Nannocystaceae bacterium]